MVRTVLLWTLLFLETGAWAQEHQRVAATTAVVHRFEAGLEGGFCPFGYALWDLSLAPRIGYELLKTWSASATLPYSWRSDPENRTVVGTPGAATLGLNWAGGGKEFRWRVGWEGAYPWNPGTGLTKAQSVDWGLQWVRDPVILGLVAGATLPESGSASGQGTLFFQEVVNDTLTWSLVLSPRCTWFDGLPLWTVGVAWKVGWYDGPTSVTSGLSTGSGAPWSWSASVGQTWDVP